MTNPVPPRPEPAATEPAATEPSDPGPAQPQQEWVAEVFRDLTAAERTDEEPTDGAPDDAPTAPPEPTPPTPESPSGPVPVRPRSRTGRITLDGLPVGGRRPDGQSWPYRLLGGLRSAVRSSRVDADLVASIEAVQRPVTTGRRIAVSGVRGGAGTTTVAALLAAVLADRRSDGVLAVDTDATLRSLLWRFGIDEPSLDRTATPDPTTDEDTEPFTPERARGLWLMPGGPDSGDVSGVGEYARFFGTTVVDLGPAYAEVGAQAAVLVASATLDGLRAVRQRADELAGPDATVARPVVALVQRTPAHDGVDLDQALILLNRLGLPALALPYDRHLAAGGPIQPDLIAEATVAAATALAAKVLAMAQPDLTPAGPTS